MVNKSTVLSKPLYENVDSSITNISSLIKGRNTRFHLCLSDASLIGVLEAYNTYKNKRKNIFNSENKKVFKNQAVITHLKKLEDAIGERIMPIDVTDEFYVEFELFLQSNGKLLSPSTIQNYFDNIRAALTWGGLHQCPLSETYKDYKLDHYEKTKIALTPSQIAHIYYFDISKNHKGISNLVKIMGIKRFSFSKLQKVKDQFVLDCNIAQRYSDASRINESCFDDSKTIYQTVQQKTGNKAKVNILKWAIDKQITMDILKKYNYQAPCYNFSINNFNIYLHLLVRYIGGEFLTLIKTENKIRGQIIVEEQPMWKLITSHTARRTFVSYWLGQGENLPAISKCTGHSDLRSIQAYAIIND